MKIKNELIFYKDRITTFRVSNSSTDSINLYYGLTYLKTLNYISNNNIANRSKDYIEELALRCLLKEYKIIYIPNTSNCD